MANSKMPANPFEAEFLDKREANCVPMTPSSFLARTAAVYPERLAVVHGGLRRNYGTLYRRARQLASALKRRGIGAGDTVAIMAPNIPEMLEAHYGVPMAGAVLNPLNVRLDPDTIAFILDHGAAKVLITDREFSPTIAAALEKATGQPAIIDIDDPLGQTGELLGEKTYEALLKEGDPGYAWLPPDDEWRALVLSYTSGTTGDPKGVVYHHRGAYINTLANIAVWAMPHHPVYLWTLPIFHSLGWCYPWTVTVLAGTHVCLRRVEPAAIFSALAEHGVTHMCGAPIVLGMIINSSAADRQPFDQTVEVMTAASPPPPTVLEKIEAMGFSITHVYGLTEVFGPATVCAWQEEWGSLSKPDQAIRKARQGVPYPTLEAMTVVEPETLKPVPADGKAVGEILLRGNTIMKGYLKNPEATNKAFDDGWFHTGDLAVQYPDGYVEIKDRSKDIIISGGENISSIEVEGVLYRHPDIVEAAVVAHPDEKWGETPCAFVTLREGARASADEIIEFCRDNLAHYKCPQSVVFGSLPKTSTGKVQKFLLRDEAQKLE